MGYLFWIVIVLSVMWTASTSDNRDLSEKILISIVYVSILIALIGLIHSNLICDMHMRAYEEGKLEKVYTIKGSDTTYRWIYREKN